MTKRATSRSGPRGRSGELDKAAVTALLRAADGLRRRFAAVLERHDLTIQQYNVLRILRGARPDPLPTMEVAERMIEKAPGITGLLDRLEAKGLLARERRSEDRRCVYASITAAGLELLAGLDEPIARADAAALGEIDGTDARRLVELLALLPPEP